MTVSVNDQKSLQGIIADWWYRHLGQRELSSTRGLAARLNRADAISALTEPAVHELMRALDWQPSPGRVQALLRLARILPLVRENIPATLAQRLGQGDPATLSALRFQRLMRAEGEELVISLRRALAMVDHRCNVARLGQDLAFWRDRNDPDDRVRTRWCFEYFGTVLPASSANIPETSPEEQTT